MRIWGHFALAVVVAVAAVPVQADEAPAPPPPAATREQKVASLLEQVRTAVHPGAAAAAYARANALKPGNVEVHETYLKRMLRFGLPQIAMYPARSLVAIEPNHALAWAVLGYLDGREEKLPEAFSATMRAIGELGADPSVLNNAGQLAAWYDYDPGVPRLSDAARRRLAQSREELSKKREFTEAYARVAKAYQQRDAVRAKYAKLVPPVEEATRALESQLAEIKLQFDSLAAEIDARNRTIETLERELNHYYWYGYGVPADYSYWYVQQRRAYLRDRIHEEQAAVDVLRQQLYRVRTAGEQVETELDAGKERLNALVSERDHALNKPYRMLRWDPPAVGGVVTPEVEYDGGLWNRSAVAPDDPEALAAQRLRVAQLYLRHDMPDKARAILLDLLEKYGSTESALPARVLLDDLSPAR